LALSFSHQQKKKEKEQTKEQVVASFRICFITVTKPKKERKVTPISH
jgi:hypothetical protein